MGTGLLTGQAPCYNIYETADRRFLALGALEPKFWRRVCEGLGRPDLVHRAFDSTALPEVRAIFQSRPLKAWLAQFSPEEVPIAPLRPLDEVPHDLHVQARGSVAWDEADLPYVPFPARFSLTPADDEPSPAPNVGEHTAEILGDELGFSAEEIRRLGEQGIIGGVTR
ncbi:MAG: CoA transferase [Ardenticatenia bacterium]|nr:CoA transferase [Ardenticatenia bacterium]